MFLTWPILAALGLGFFLIGTVVGSFLNVCIYRIPWQKSVIWPGSRCPQLFRGHRGARQHPDRELARPARRVPPVRRADLGALSAGRSPGRVVVPGCLSRGRDRRTTRVLGRNSAVSAAGGCLPCPLPGAPGRRHVHRLRPDDHPRPDHGHRHGPGGRAGDALAAGSARAGRAATHAPGSLGRCSRPAGRRGLDPGLSGRRPASSSAARRWASATSPSWE